MSWTGVGLSLGRNDGRTLSYGFIAHREHLTRVGPSRRFLSTASSVRRQGTRPNRPTWDLVSPLLPNSIDGSRGRRDGDRRGGGRRQWPVLDIAPQQGRSSSPARVRWRDRTVEGGEAFPDVRNVVEHDAVSFHPGMEVEVAGVGAVLRATSTNADPQLRRDTSATQEPPKGHGALEAVRPPQATLGRDVDHPGGPAGRLKIGSFGVGRRVNLEGPLEPRLDPAQTVAPQRQRHQR